MRQAPISASILIVVGTIVAVRMPLAASGQNDMSHQLCLPRWPTDPGKSQFVACFGPDAMQESTLPVAHSAGHIEVSYSGGRNHQRGRLLG